MLKVEGIDVNIGATPILRGVSLEVPSGTMCGLIGRNGAGKTTFMRAVMGALGLRNGQIEFDGEKLHEAPAHQRAHIGIGFIVAFARALMVGTKFLMLDEPSEGIAPVFAQRMVEIIKSLKEEGESVLVAESNDKHIKELLDRSFVIERGSIINA